MAASGDTAARAETIDLDSATAETLASLAQELYPVHNEIFAGWDEARFTSYLFHSGADRTRVGVYRNDRGEPVGYAVLHLHRRTVRERRLAVFRAEAGLLPRYRGRDTTFRFYALEMLKYRLMHPRDDLVYLGMLVHPSSYLAFAQSCHRMYPTYDRDVPPEILELMTNLADLFGVPPVDEGDPLIRRFGVPTRQEKAFWTETEIPEVVFFRTRNPGYREGNALLTLVPLTLSNLLMTFVLHAIALFRRRMHAEGH